MIGILNQGDNWTIVIGSDHFTLTPAHMNYDKIVDLLKESGPAADEEQLRDLLDVEKSLNAWLDKVADIKIENSEFIYNDRVVDNALTDRIINMYRHGFAVDSLVNFFKNLQRNPSHRAVGELYRFLECNNLPITEDGCFLAYKRVRSDYTDCYTGKIDNHVGAVVTEDRNLVDDDPRNTCSKGLHFCSREYLGRFYGENVMILKIDPADVVSIPVDYNNSKGRCCKYEVVGQLSKEEDSSLDEFESRPVYSQDDMDDEGFGTPSNDFTNNDDWEDNDSFFDDWNRF